MANKITIDVEARFVDNLSGQADAASDALKDVETEAKDAAKAVGDLGKKRVKPKVDVDNSQATRKVKDTADRLKKLDNSKTEAKLSALDRASAVVKKVTSKLKSFGNKSHSALVKIRDSNALSSLSNLSSRMKSFTGKTWSTAVRIKDTFTAPLTRLKNMLFNIKTLIAGIATAWAAVQLVKNPINVADSYSSAKISFSTLLGESQGQQMMDNLDEFAKATPFNTTNVIGNAQKMLAMGWEAENIIDDMEIIGNAAAATGKLDQGLESIVRALSQIKTKGRLSTEELNQLAEAGISAKAMLAEELGYGTGDEGIAKMTEDLEDGAIASNKAIEALLAGMKKYDGMMDSMANETVEGLASQIGDAFQINIVRKWGQGLQDGAKRGFGTVVDLLDEAEAALSNLGDMLYELGKTASNWVADKFQNIVDKVLEITDSYEFRNASLSGKVSMLWNGVIVDPLKEWWENGGQKKTAETAGKIGSWTGKMITKGLLALFGVTDVFADTEFGENGGMSVAQSFVKGFKENFDGSAITDAFVDAISDIWGALPWWAKILIGGYGVGKAAGGIANFAGGILKFAGGLKNLIGSYSAGTGLIGAIGSTGNYMVKGTGILGKLASAGYAFTGGPASAGAYFGAGMSGGTAALLGGAGIAGTVAAAASVIKGGADLYSAYRAHKRGDTIERDANIVSGGMALSGTALGASIGTLILPGLGTAIGAGIGGIAGWLGGDAMANKIREARYESEEMKAAIKDSEMSAEELQKIFEQAKWENAKKHFGDIALSMSEIERLADQIVWGDDMGYFEKFSSATKTAEANLQTLKTAAEQSERWMWKAGLGVKFNEDEIESIEQSFDDYINAAKSFVENKHYEFTAAVSLLVDPETKNGKSIIESGNAFYGKMQEQLEELGSKLSKKVDIALEDGVITLNEQKEIINLQQQIASITEKIANAEQKAELDLITLKFGNGNLDVDSFENFMTQMRTTIDERMAANDEAFVASVSSLNLQLEEGAISQEEYDKQLQTIVNGYTSTVENLQADVKKVELNIIGEAYADELGADAAADLEKALQYAIDNDIDPIDITDDKLAKLLNIKVDGNGETLSNIREMLSGVLGHLELLEVDGNLMLKVGEVEVEDGTEEKVEGAVGKMVPAQVEKTVGVDITGEPEIQNSISILTEDFGIEKSQAAVISLLLTGDKEILNKIDTTTLANEFGIEESQAEHIIMRLSGSKSIENRVDVLAEEFGIPKDIAATILNRLTGEKVILNTLTPTAGDFGIPDSISKTISVNFTAIKGKVKNAIGNLFGGGGDDDKGGSGYRGGIFGGESAMDAFARGGRTDNSGIVGGSTRFIRVNEEAPEMVIPLSSQRRDRALKLWNKTGELLNVPGFARGGHTDGGAEEWADFKANHSGEVTGGGQSVQIDIGGITFEIHVEGGDPDKITEAIREQMPEITEMIAGILNDSFTGQFENTPTRGGAA